MATALHGFITFMTGYLIGWHYIGKSPFNVVPISADLCTIATRAILTGGGRVIAMKKHAKQHKVYFSVNSFALFKMFC